MTSYTKDIESLELLRQTVIRVYEDDNQLYECGLVAVLWNCDDNQTKRIDISSYFRFKMLLLMLKGSWELEEVVNDNGSVKVDDLTVEIMASLTIPVMLNEIQLHELFDPLDVTQFRFNIQTPFAYLAMFNYHLSAMDVFSIESIIGVEIARQFRWLTVDTDGTEARGDGFEFVVTSLEGLDNL